MTQWGLLYLGRLVVFLSGGCGRGVPPFFFDATTTAASPFFYTQQCLKYCTQKRPEPPRLPDRSGDDVELWIRRSLFFFLMAGNLNIFLVATDLIPVTPP